MARPPRPWYRKDRGVWMVVVNGTRHNLGPEKGPALRAFHALLAGGGVLTPPPAATPSLTFAELVDRFQEYRKGRVAPDTHEVTRFYLKPFKELLGDKAASLVLGSDVLGVVSGHAAWGQTSRHLALARLSTLFRWALRAGLVESDPTAGLPRPRPRSRGAEVLPPPGAQEQILAAASPALGAVLTCLYDTGARPGEVIRVTALDFQPDVPAWVLADHKTAGVTGRPRVIHLTERVAQLCRDRAALYPKGPLFRAPRGGPYPSGRVVSRAFRALRKKLGLPRTVVPYSLRHLFVTEALLGGTPDSVVAALVGHSSTRMVTTVYGHVAQNSRVLQEALNKIRSK
jgi:integrase